MVMTTRRRTLCSPFSRGRTLGDGGGTPAGPSITVQPSDSTVKAPAAFTMSVTATGTAPLTYQWYEGNAGGPEIPGQTGTTLSLATYGGEASYEKRFHVVVRDAGGRYTRSRIAVVTITPAGTYTVPSFAGGSQPQSVQAVAGTTLITKMFATASGNPSPAYQWQERLPAITGTWTSIASATAPWDAKGWAGETSSALSFMTLPALTDNGREFRCKATNTEGTDYSTSAFLFVTGGGGGGGGANDVDCLTSPVAASISNLVYSKMQVFTDTGAAATTLTRPASHATARVSGAELVAYSEGTEIPKMYDASGTGTAGQWKLECNTQLGEGVRRTTFSWAALAVTPTSVRININDLHMEQGLNNGVATEPYIKFEVLQSGVSKAIQNFMSLAELNTWKAAQVPAGGPWTLTLTGLANENLSTLTVRITIFSRHTYSGVIPQVPPPQQWVTISDIVVTS